MSQLATQLAEAPNHQKAKRTPPPNSTKRRRGPRSLCEWSRRYSFRVDEIPFYTGIPIEIVEQAVASGELPRSPVAEGVEILLRPDVERWIASRRCIPADAETIETLKKRRPATLPGESSEASARRARALRRFEQLQQGQQ